jgi:hypothetical protein
VRVEERGNQPSPKKLKTGHVTPNPKTSTPNLTNTQGSGYEGGKSRGGVGDRYKSAPCKMYNEKK